MNSSNLLFFFGLFLVFGISFANFAHAYTLDYAQDTIEGTPSCLSTTGTATGLTITDVTDIDFEEDESYLIIATSSIAGGSTTEEYSTRVLHGTTVFEGSEHVFEPDEAGSCSTDEQFYKYFWFTVWTPSNPTEAGEDISIEYESLDGSDLYYDDVVLNVVHLDSAVMDEDEDWFFVQDTTDTTLQQSWGTPNNATLNFTPTVDDNDWLLMGSNQLDTGAGNVQYMTRLFVTGAETDLPIRSQEGEDPAEDLFVQTFARVITIDNSTASNIQVQAQLDNGGGGTQERLNSQLFALNLDIFHENAWEFTGGTVNVGGAEYGTLVASETFTPTVNNAPVMIISDVGSQDTAGGDDIEFRTQVDGTDLISGMTGESYDYNPEWDGSDTLFWANAKITTMTNSSHTIDIDGSETGGGVESIYPSLIIFPLTLGANFGDITDMVNATDDVSSVQSWFGNVTSIVNATDTVGGTQGINQNATDIVTATDFVNGTVAYFGNVLDNVNATDNTTMTFNVTQSITDIVNATDITGSIISIGQNMTDIVNATDSITGIAGFFGNVTDIVNATDILIQTQNVTQGTVDIVNATDIVNGTQAIFEDITDMVNATDILNSTEGFFGNTTDTVTIIDSATGVMSVFTGVLDIVNVFDGVGNAFNDESQPTIIVDGGSGGTTIINNFGGNQPAPTIPDSDNDGILDPNDACPLQPENFNNYIDTDGCPDTVPFEEPEQFTIPDVVDIIPFEFNELDVVDDSIELDTEDPQPQVEELQVRWLGDSELTITNIQTDVSPFEFQFEQVPQVVGNNQFGLTETKVLYTVQEPATICINQFTLDCVAPVTYDIPVIVTGEVDGKVVIAEGRILVDNSDRLNPYALLLWSTFLIPIIGIYFWKRRRDRRQKSARDTLKPSNTGVLGATTLTLVKKQAPQKKGTVKKQLEVKAPPKPEAKKPEKKKTVKKKEPKKTKTNIFGQKSKK